MHLIPLRRGLLAALVCLLPVADAGADSKERIDAGVARTLEWFAGTRETRSLVKRAKAILVFPDVIEMGFGVGGEFGEGALVVDGEIEAYYATAGKTFGMPERSPFKGEAVFFFSEAGLAAFRQIRTWRPARHGLVRVVNDPDEIRDALRDKSPLVGLIFTENGIVGGLDMATDRITRIIRE
ncbi:MAG: hypothetical protein HKN19_04120 [Halioglobus sp.]|nr:hypothetical protein [Halioglobus sp.]